MQGFGCWTRSVRRAKEKKGGNEVTQALGIVRSHYHA